MLSSLKSFLCSSIGKKLVMALTGLALLLFLIGHVAGNLLLFAGDEGELFTKYAHALQTNPALPLVEFGLLAIFVVHIALAVRLTLDNKEARTKGYAVRATKGRSTVASGTMIVSGVVILIFVVIHLLDFRFDDDSEVRLYEMVEERLGGIAGCLIYTVSMVFLTLHLSHGARSALQTLGLRHPRWNVVIERAGMALAILLGLLFLAFPLIFFIKGV